MARDEVRFPHVLFWHAATTSPSKEAWQPRADVYRMPGGWLVKFELAGVRPEDVRVTVREGSLLVQGTRRDESRCDGVDFYRMEITYSRFERSIQLPCSLAGAKIQSEYDNGLLTMTFLLKGGGSEERANE